MSTIQLVYCRENADLAEKLAHQLGRIGIPFQHLTNRPEDPPGYLSRQVQGSYDPVLLILTDNFLRNTACMCAALAMYQSLVRQNRVLTVVADGRISRDGGHSFEPVPTQFDRVVHAIQYMNFWQTAYLDRNAGFTQVPPAEKERFEQELDVVRGIANEIGELFSALRDSGYSTWAQFEAEDYTLFFRHFGLQDWHEQYRKLASLEEQPMPPIPEEAPATRVAEIPVFSGPLAPAPMEEPVAALAQTPSFNGLNSLRQAEQTEASTAPVVSAPPPEQEETKSILERLIEEPEEQPDATEENIREMTRDAWFWLEKGYAERGLELFRLALEQYPEHKGLRAEYEGALAAYGKVEPEPAVEPAPEPPVEIPAPDHAQEAASYDLMGENALAKGDFLLAKYCWDRVTELQPQFPGIYRKLALLTSDHLTDYKETAAHYLEEALAADPNDADLHFRLALLLRDHLGQPDQALQHFRDTVVQEAGHAQAWLALAEAALDAGDGLQAETLYRHALQLNSGLKTDALDARFLPPAPQPAPPETAEALQTPLPDENTAVPGEPEQEPVTRGAGQAAYEKTAEPLTVLITGATSGIGRATANMFARHGHRVILTGRREDRLDDLKASFGANYNNDILTLAFDVRDPGSVRQTLENLPEDWQQIDLLINNAGLAKGLAPIHEGNLDHWETMIDTNIKGLLYVTRCIAPGMVRRRKGHIINVGSIAGREVYPQGNVYCATKSAVDTLTRAMRLDLHAYNIRVGQVTPGHVEETEFALNRFDGDTEKARIYDNFQPLKASDIAETIYFMATRPPHVNIQDIYLFGTQQASATLIDRSGRE